MIIWVASFPRSGNTFFRILLHQLYGLDNYTVYSTNQAVKEGVANRLNHKELPGTLDEIRARPEPYFIKTHELPSDDEMAIYLVRDGRDAIVSFTHYHLNFDAKPEEKQLVLDPRWRARVARMLGRKETVFAVALRRMIKKAPYGGWGGHALAWARDRAPSKTIVIRFEDLIADPLVTMDAAIAKLPVKIERISDQVPTFDELQGGNNKFFRKGKVRGWREEMRWDLHRLFWKHHAEAMRFLGYRR